MRCGIQKSSALNTVSPGKQLQSETPRISVYMRNTSKLLRPFLLSTLFLLILGASSLFAQSFAEIDRFLEQEELSFAQAAGFVLMAAELIGEEADIETVLAAAAGLGTLPNRIARARDSSNTSIKLDELCFLIAKSFNIKGSFLYGLFSGPRYGYRRMSSLRLLPEPNDPAMKVSGLQLMYIVEKVLHYIENNKNAARNAEMGRLSARGQVEQGITQAAAKKAAAEQAERDRIAAEKAAAERAAVQKAEAERLAALSQAERAAAQKAAAEQAERDRIAAEKAAAERAAAQKAEAERLAALSQAERVAAQKAAAEQAERDRVAAEKVAAERAAVQKAEADRLAALSQAERAAAQKAAAEQAERDRIAAEKAAAERAAAQKAEAERLAALSQAERAAAQRAAAEQAERDRVAAEKAAAERAAAQNAGVIQTRNPDITLRVVEEGLMVNLTMQFAPDLAVLTEREQAKIREIAEVLKDYPGRPVLLVGHTAMTGTPGARANLSRVRAQEVADYLVQLGSRRADEITVRGMGAEQSVADNRTDVGMSLNRRVEVIILDKK
ncbi:hypothetical protein AGMMS49546_30400 [Spirochaetia bacterium]|nr:hypothetical protein AGMMS49546_30400 [Spirochaetia bacterium]